MLQENLLGNRIIRLSDGKVIGSVNRVYLDEDRQSLEKIRFGDNHFIRYHEIAFLGEDVVFIHRKKAAKAFKNPADTNTEHSSMICAADKNTSTEATAINWWVAVN